jgi:hypothetical protein
MSSWSCGCNESQSPTRSNNDRNRWLRNVAASPRPSSVTTSTFSAAKGLDRVLQRDPGECQDGPRQMPSPFVAEFAVGGTAVRFAQLVIEDLGGVDVVERDGDPVPGLANPFSVLLRGQLSRFDLHGVESSPERPACESTVFSQPQRHASRGHDVRRPEV